MTDLINGMKYLNERIDFWIQHILNHETEVNSEFLFDCTADIIDEWTYDMELYGYIYDELKEKLNKKGVEMTE